MVSVPHYCVGLLQVCFQKMIALLPDITLTSIAGCDTARGDADNITHAVLVPLIAVLHARVGTLEAVVPGGDA